MSLAGENNESTACSFTAIIPTYNRGRFVGRAIESVLTQTLAPVQVIVVDDGSTDNTAEVCARYGDKIQFVRQRNAGVAVARNRGIRQATEPWTAFLDSDDHWMPDHLEKIAGAICATAGRARFYFSNLGMGTGPDRRTVWERIGFSVDGPHRFTLDGTEWMLAQRQPSYLPCSVFETRALIASGGFNPHYRIMEDTELFCRLGIQAPVCAVNTVGCIETADDAPENRLTGILHGYTAGYWEHECEIWTQLLSRFSFNPEHQRVLEYSLATAHWRLARLHWRGRNVWRSAKNLVASGAAQPALLLWLLRYGRSHGWEAGVFPKHGVS